MKAKKKRTGLRPLVNRLDRAFSRYVRMKAADENGTVECVTCHRLLHWKQAHAGHFVKRQHMSLRWCEDPPNVLPQCVKCNLHMGGRQDDFALHILKTRGEGALTYLLSKKQEVKKWTRDELETLISKYEQAAAREQERIRDV